ncbi:MAG: DUF1127 domain-containing protein [Pseudomonadota bacterium]
MAAFDTTRPRHGSASVAGLISATFATLVGRLVDWNNARETRNALHKLTDRELDDIGLVRGEIDSLPNCR